MFRIFAFALLLVVLLSQFTVPVALAASEPVGSCPTGFTLEPVMDGDHQHMHVGVDTDQNRDGYICMKHVTPGEDIHIHTDNNLP